MKGKRIAILGGAAALVATVTLATVALNGNETGDKPLAGTSAAAPAHEITVYKSENCSCCQSWAEHLEANGFDVNLVVTRNLNEIKQEHGVPRAMQSCHTAVMGDLVIEGHVPAEDILAYLEAPVFNTTGLAVPGMPHGTPGMETGRTDEYAVMRFNASGNSSVFREH